VGDGFELEGGVQDRAAVDAGRVNQPGDRLDRDDPADDQQRDAVARGGQDLRALPAEGPGPGGRAGGEPDSPQRPGDGPALTFWFLPSAIAAPVIARAIARANGRRRGPS